MVSIREFTNNAMNHHHGIQSVERFGDGIDFDEDGYVNELTVGDVTAVTLFQAALPVPTHVAPACPARRGAAGRGQRVFDEVGCTSCHVRFLDLESRMFSEPNPFNPKGNLRRADVSRPYVFDMTRSGRGPHIRPLRGGDLLPRRRGP